MSERGAAALGCAVAEPVGRSREAPPVEAREILMVVGVGRCALLVKAVAAALDRYGGTASRWISRGAALRQVNGEYRGRLEEVDQDGGTVRGLVNIAILL